MYSIHLHQLNFFSYHGVHEEEKILGGEFEINIDIDFTSKDNIVSINDTIDYVKVYEIVKNRMSIATPLLETLAYDIAKLIHAVNDSIFSININIKKINPPIINFVGSVSVTYKKEF